ncbi:MAG: hypothetical protein JSS69_12780 [Acidobacteria bacterium]|nr:hypothetical protein [Acidobacteriota bacterium]MBS1866781.1 hypothetical protein [Acidobacteriota bacterium]
MMSVALNEAIELRRTGSLMKAYEVAQTACGVCVRFAQGMETVLDGLHRHAKHLGLVPSAAPLSAENFRGSRGQRTARITGFLNKVLLSRRSQFIHKAATLKEMVAELKDEFSKTVEDLVGGLDVRTDGLWDCLDCCQFDLNTCLRETVVLLKSFLVALPDDQIASFESELKLPSVRTAPRSFAFRHRRFAAVPGK